MQAKKKSSIWKNMLMAVLSVALVFTMMPLSMGAVYADDAAAFTIVDTDGSTTTFTMEQMDGFQKVTDYTITSDGKDVVINSGIIVKNFLKSYQSKETAIVTVTTADNYPTVNASGKTVKELRSNDYILATQVNGEEPFTPGYDRPTGKYNDDGTPKTKPDEGYFVLYGKDANGNYTRDKWVNKFALSEEGGSGGDEPGDDPVVEMADLTIQGDALVKSQEFSIKELKKEIEIERFTSLPYPSLNNYGTRETSKVDGVNLIDLINYVGLKDGVKITKVEAIPYKNGQPDTGYIKTYTAEQIQNEDIYGNKAMFIWGEQEDGATTVNKVQRTIRGQFSEDDVNRANWGKDIKVINVYGEVETTPEPSTEPAAVKDGQTVTVEGNTYTVLSTSAGTVAFTKAKNTKRAIVPVSVKVDGKTYKVTQVNANAFTGSKIKSAVVNKNVKKIKKNAFKNSKAVQLIVKTKKLTKKSVKGSLKGSKIKKVVVKVGSKKANKKYVKKYKKYFTKKNAGKKVKVVKAN